MNLDYYESKIAKISEADFVNEGIADFTKGNIKDGNEINIC